MSTSYHTPIVNGDPRKNDAAIWNDALGELDDALGLLHSENQALGDTLDGLIINDGTGNAEVIAARTGINYKAGTPPALLEDALEYAAGDTYNVKAYGAVGNGSAFDTLAIQAALDAAAAAGGGVVFFPRGTYKFSAALTMADNVTIRGVGPKSILDWQGVLNGSAITMGTTTGTTVERLLIQNLTAVSGGNAITGGGQRQVVRDVSVIGKVVSAPISTITGSGTITVTTSAPHGLSSGNTVWLFNTNLAVDIARKSNITVTSATVFTASGSTPASYIGATTRQENWQGGILLSGSDSIVERCYVSAGVYVAIRLEGGSTRCQAHHNNISDTIRAFMVDAGATYDSITDNVATTCAHIFCKIETGCSYITISHNFAIDCSKGIVEAVGTIVTFGAYTVIESNQLLFSGTVLSTAGIYVHTDANYSVVRNNSVKNHSGVGIQLRFSAANIIVSGNFVTGGVTGVSFGYSPLANTIISGNHLDGQSDYGIFAHGGGAGPGQFVIMNNIINNIGKDGIYIEGRATQVVVCGNIIQVCGWSGIRLDDESATCSYVAISANAIFDVGNLNDANEDLKSHISLSGLQNHIAVVGNACNDTTGADSIRAASTSNSTVIGNVTSAGLSAVGSGTLVANNI